MELRCFPIRDEWINKKTNYQKPRELGCFSWDRNRTLHVNERGSLHSFAPPISVPWIDDAGMGCVPSAAINVDLNDGFPEKFVCASANVPEKLDHLLFALEKVTGSSVPDADFVTWRGIMTKILQAPYSKRDEWSLVASLKGGVIYLEEEGAADSTRDDAYTRSVAVEDTERRNMYYGYKFETLLTGNDGDVDTREQFCTIFRSRLGQHALIMGGEVDAICGQDYVELKCFYLNPDNPETFSKRLFSLERFKFLSSWAQSFLAGVPYIVFGFRDESGRLLSTQSFQVLKIPKLLANKKSLWNYNVCLSFADHFLSELKQFFHSSNVKDGRVLIRKQDSTIKMTIIS